MVDTFKETKEKDKNVGQMDKKEFVECESHIQTY